MSKKKQTKVDPEQDRQSEDRQKVDVRVLGQILAAQNVIFALPDATRIAEFYAQTLLSIPGITACRVCLGGHSSQAGDMEDIPCAECDASRRKSDQSTVLPVDSNFKCSMANQPDLRVIAIDSYQHHFGFFVFKIDHAADFDAYHPFINNLSNYVAITIENRLQKEQLQKAHHELERRVEARTRDLTLANADLQREIAERRRTEEALRESKEQVRQLFDASPVAMAVSSGTDERVETVNSKYTELFGYTIEDVSDVAHWWQLAYPDEEYREKVKLQWITKVEQTRMGGKQTEPVEAMVTCKDGSQRYVEFRLSLVGEKQLVTFVDLTERKQAEEALWKSSQMLKLVLDNMPAFVFWKDHNSVYLGCNNLFAANAGFDSPEKIIGLTDLDLPWKHTETGSYRADDRLVMESGIPKLNYEETQLTADGQIIAMRTSKIPLRNPKGDIIGVLGTFEDITESKQAEAEIQALAKFPRENPNPVMRVTKDGVLLYANPASADLLHYWNCSVGGQLPGTWRKFAQDTLSASSFRDTEIICDEKIFTLIFTPIIENGYVNLYAIDITDRKKAERALRESEWMYREIFDNVLDGLYLLQITEAGRFRVMEVNPAVERITGISCSSFPGKTPEEILPAEVAAIINEKLRHCIETGQPTEEEAELDLPVGRRNIQSTLIPAQDETGKVRRIIGISRDVTEHKLAENALRESEEKYRLLHENAGVGIGYYKPDGQVISYNQLAASHMGGKPEDFEGKSIYEIFPREEADFYIGRIKRSLQTESTLEYEDHLELPSGEKWFLSTFTKICDARQNVIGVQIISQDITEQKWVEEALRASENRFRVLSENAFVGIYIIQDSRLSYVNSTLAKIFGYTSEELTGAKPEVVIHPDDRAMVLENIRRRIDGEIETIHYEFRGQCKDGGIKNIEVLGGRSDFGGKTAVIGNLMDITDRKRSEEALRDSERRLIEAQRIAHVGYWERNFEAGQIILSDEACRIFGLSPQEVPFNLEQWHQRWLELIHPEDQSRAGKAAADALGGDPPYNVEYRIIRPGGEVRFIHSEASVRRDESGRPRYMLGMMQDITDRKRAELEIARSLAAEKKARKVAEILREANESLSRTLYLDDVLQNLLDYLMQLVPYDSANVMLREGDFHFRVVALRGYERWTDLDAAQKLVFDIRTIPSLSELVAAQKSTVIANTYEYPGWLRISGTEHVVSWLGIPIIADGQVIGLYSVDKVKPAFFTNEHRLLAEGLAAQASVAIQNTRLHDQITHANMELEQRVASRTAQLEEANKELEAFAYSVSHDLRAPLRHIDGFIDMLQKRTVATLDEKSRHYMDVIADSAGKMGVLIDDLLSFSRMGRSEMFKSQVDLNDLVQDVVREAMSETEGRNIHWEISSLPVVIGDRAMLRIVLVNLIANALKFTRSRKVAQIEIGRERRDAAEMVIFVRDNGVGFDMSYADKLFGVFQRLHRQEDFEGTGIGLANVRRIINRHGGETWAEGEPGHGATFYFSLPQTK